MKPGTLVVDLLRDTGAIVLGSRDRDITIRHHDGLVETVSREWLESADDSDPLACARGLGNAIVPSLVAWALFLGWWLA